jgi:hypothetical protein
MERIIRAEITFFFIVLAVFLSTEDVLAQGWWGKGVKSDNWILQNGGALIRFEIYNKQGESNEYKTLLTRSGKKIEVELGKQGIFDDGRDNRYKVTFYRGGDGLKSFDNLGNEIASKTFDVHKGESIKLRLNYKTKKISFETTYVEPEEEDEKKEEKKAVIAKVQPKKIPAPVVAEEVEAPLPEKLPEPACFDGLFRPAVCRNLSFPLAPVASRLAAPAEKIAKKENISESYERIYWQNMGDFWKKYLLNK